MSEKAIYRIFIALEKAIKTVSEYNGLLEAEVAELRERVAELEKRIESWQKTRHIMYGEGD